MAAFGRGADSGDTDRAEVKLAGGVPFVSDTDLEAALTDAGVKPEVAQSIVDDNADARLVALRASLSAVALVALLALFFTGSIPEVQAADEERDDAAEELSTA